MSLERWKREYYPINASEFEDKTLLEAVEHSLKKWEGLSEEVVEEYNLSFTCVSAGKVAYSKLEGMPINGSTCSLCVKQSSRIYYTGCNGCALYVSLGGVSCSDDSLEPSPYRKMMESGDPTSMIEALRKTVEMVKDNPEKWGE